MPPPNPRKPVQGLLEFLAEELGLNKIAFRPDLEFVPHQFLQQFGGDVLVFEPAQPKGCAQSSINSSASAPIKSASEAQSFVGVRS
jgi:hypothetical protein